MPDAAVAPPAEPERDHVTHLDAGNGWSFDGAVSHNLPGAKHTINAKPPGFMCLYSVPDLVRGKAINVSMPPGGLVWWIVWHFGLVEIDAAAVAVPHRLIPLTMFDKQSVEGQIVPVHSQTGNAFIQVPAHAPAVVRAPKPEIVAHDIVATNEMRFI